MFPIPGVELFPTHLRSTAMAVTLVAARLGAILGNTVFALFLEVQCAIPILMVASLLVGKIYLIYLMCLIVKLCHGSISSGWTSRINSPKHNKHSIGIIRVNLC